MRPDACHFDAGDWQAFTSLLAKRWHVDWSGYKQAQLQRRTRGFLAYEGLPSLRALAAKVASDGALVARLHSYLTIHVTEFFRDPDFWRRLGRLLQSRPAGELRAWSAGTAWGAEAVSLGLLCEQLNLCYTILATDNDADTITAARTFEYPAAVAAALPTALRSALQPGGPGQVRLAPRIASRITFRVHHLLRDPFPTGPFDLILCRNVLIYFEPPTRLEAIGRFTTGLAENGILGLGATEALLECHQFGLVNVAPSLYQKR